MKKIYLWLATLIAVLTFGACKNSVGYDLYVPDGAPTLAVSKLLTEGDEEITFHVVDSSTISAYVTGQSPKADFCVLPVNAAAKLLGSGESYVLLGVATHGNLFFLSKNSETYNTKESLTNLIGKKVATIQINNVPGLVLKTVLQGQGVPYQESTLNAVSDTEKVNLIPIEPTEISPALDVDVFVCAEPLASTKVKATASTKNPMQIVGSLQTLYGENGYPQAVLVAKKSVAQKEKALMERLIEQMTASAEWILSNETTPEQIVNGIKSHLTEGLSPSFKVDNLSKTVIRNCNISFTKSPDCKAEVKNFLEALSAVNDNFSATVSDGFFWSAE